MQVNLNSNINQTQPNFKASFADDSKTKKALKYFIIDDKEDILSIQYMLEDIKTDDKISLRRKETRIGGFTHYAYFAKNLTNGKEFILHDGDVYRGGRPLSVLDRIISSGELLGKEPEWNEDYYEKAVNLIEEQSSKKQEIVNKLKKEIESLKRILAKKEKEFLNKEHTCFQDSFEIAKKELFSRIKK